MSNVLQRFNNLVENQFNSYVQVIRTDNAKDLCDGESLKIYQTNGIEHQSSCVHTSQQNGVVEHKHRHLLKVARALKF